MERRWIRKLNQLYWPDVGDAEGARRAAGHAAGAAFCVSGVDAFVAIVSRFGIAIPYMDIWSLLDAALFAILGIGIRRMWRSAAIIALLLFIIVRIAAGRANGLIVATISLIVVAILTVFFISGVRGTFAYHKFVKEGDGTP